MSSSTSYAAITARRVVDGNSGTATVCVTVLLSSASAQPVTVSYVIDSPGYGGTAGVDFLAGSGTVTFAAGQTEVRNPVTVYGDTTWEDEEVARVRLTGVTGAEFDPFSGTPETFIITNDDLPTAASIARTSARSV